MAYDTTSSTTFYKPTYGVQIINISDPKLNSRNSTYFQDVEINKKNEKIFLQYMRTTYYINHLNSNMNTGNGSSKLYSDINLDVCSMPNSSKYTITCIDHDRIKQKEIDKDNNKDTKKKDYVNLKTKTTNDLTCNNSCKNSKNLFCEYADNLLIDNKQKTNLKRTETFNLIVAPCKNKSARIVLNKFSKLSTYINNNNNSNYTDPIRKKIDKTFDYNINFLPKKFHLPEELKNNVLMKKNKCIENNIEKNHKRCSKCCCPVLPVPYQDIPKEILNKSRKLRKPPRYKCEETQTSPRMLGQGDINDIIVNVVTTKSEDDICIGLKMKDEQNEEVYIRCQPNEDINVQNCIKFFKNEIVKKTYEKQEKYFSKDEQNLFVKEIFNTKNIFKKFNKF